MALPVWADDGDETVSLFEDRDVALQELKDHLLIAPFGVWLDVIRRSDVARHYQLLTWMIEQPECDTTIAQMVFFHCKPALMIERQPTGSPSFPDHDALCRTVAENYAAGQYLHTEVGLIRGELDARIEALRGVLEYIRPEDRVFEVPAAFLTVPDIPHQPLADVWTAEGDDQINMIYRANGLEVLTSNAPVATADEPGLVENIVESIVSLVRRPRRAR